jgi:hypothetical protein
MGVRCPAWIYEIELREELAAENRDPRASRLRPLKDTARSWLHRVVARSKSSVARHCASIALVNFNKVTAMHHEAGGGWSLTELISGKRGCLDLAGLPGVGSPWPRIVVHDLTACVSTSPRLRHGLLFEFPIFKEAIEHMIGASYVPGAVVAGVRIAGPRWGRPIDDDG